MEFWQQLVLTFCLSGAAASVLTYVLLRASDRIRLDDVETKSRNILQRAEMDAERQRRESELHAKELAIQHKEKNEKELQKNRQEFHERERSLDKRQDSLDKLSDDLKKQEKIVENTQRRLKEKLDESQKHGDELTQLIAQQRQALHQITGLSNEEAKAMLFSSLERELHGELGGVILRHEKRLSEQCDELARNALLLSIHRYAAAHTAESTTSSIDLPTDDMKGRIIGREGRNIRAFEKATGVDVIIDDTPGVVIVSGFDPIRREVARLSLARLILDGRIHPSRIEEIVAETAAEVDAFVRKAGIQACHEVDIHDLNERLIDLLGRMYFRTSYSQNVLRHSIEVAFISGMIAVELGLNERLARRCGLLHDIGKAFDHEVEGGHPRIGADLLKKLGEPIEVVQAAAGHHEDPKCDNPYTIIVAAADACSAGRPGARRETLEHYVKRMEELESVANEFEGVDQAFAVQAGREIRVLANAGKTTDESAAKICRDIVKSLKERVQFPGEIKVTLIRESRFTEIAE